MEKVAGFAPGRKEGIGPYLEVLQIGQLQRMIAYFVLLLAVFCQS